MATRIKRKVNKRLGQGSSAGKIGEDYAFPVFLLDSDANGKRVIGCTGYWETVTSTRRRVRWNVKEASMRWKHRAASSSGRGGVRVQMKSVYTRYEFIRLIKRESVP